LDGRDRTSGAGKKGVVVAQETEQAKFEGWAVVEMMGHRKEIGYVTTQVFGQAVMFRVDTPELPERQFILQRPQYVGAQYMPAGTEVKRESVPARSVLVAPSSLYAINPCSEEAARLAIEHNIIPALIVVGSPLAALPAPGEDNIEDDEDGTEGNPNADLF
jgi:hypothetical protein